MKLTNIASLDPTITSSGRAGLRNASANDRAMWDEMHSDWARFAVESQRTMEAVEAMVGSVASTSEDEDEDDSRIGEDRIALATTRIGQRFFRAAVMSAYNRRCCITGLSTPTLLVASHIVPWSHDESSRINPRNGLLLSALHDRAFDRGLITIDDDMTVRVSTSRAVTTDRFFSVSIGAYHGRQISLPEKFVPDGSFLAYHREHIFVP